MDITSCANASASVVLEPLEGPPYLIAETHSQRRGVVRTPSTPLQESMSRGRCTVPMRVLLMEDTGSSSQAKNCRWPPQPEPPSAPSPRHGKLESNLHGEASAKGAALRAGMSCLAPQDTCQELAGKLVGGFQDKYDPISKHSATRKTASGCLTPEGQALAATSTDHRIQKPREGFSTRARGSIEAQRLARRGSIMLFCFNKNPMGGPENMGS